MIGWAGGGVVTYVDLVTTSEHVVDTDEAGGFNIQVLVNGALSSLAFFNGYNGTVGQGDIIFNEDSNNIDFRVESDNNVNAFFVEGSSGFTGFGTGSPSHTAHFVSSTINSPTLAIENNNDNAAGASFILIKDGTSAAANDEIGEIVWEGDDDGGNSDEYAAIKVLSERIVQGEESGSFDFELKMSNVSRTSFLYLDAYNGTDNQGSIIFNEDSNDIDFRVESTNDANALFIQGSNGDVGIGTGSPSEIVHITSSAAFEPTLLLEGTNAANAQPIIICRR